MVEAIDVWQDMKTVRSLCLNVLQKTSFGLQIRSGGWSISAVFRLVYDNHKGGVLVRLRQKGDFAILRNHEALACSSRPPRAVSAQENKNRHGKYKQTKDYKFAFHALNRHRNGRFLYGIPDQPHLEHLVSPGGIIALYDGHCTSRRILRF